MAKSSRTKRTVIDISSSSEEASGDEESEEEEESEWDDDSDAASIDDSDSSSESNGDSEDEDESSSSSSGSQQHDIQEEGEESGSDRVLRLLQGLVLLLGSGENLGSLICCSLLPPLIAPSPSSEFTSAGTGSDTTAIGSNLTSSISFPLTAELIDSIIALVSTIARFESTITDSILIKFYQIIKKNTLSKAANPQGIILFPLFLCFVFVYTLQVHDNTEALFRRPISTSTGRNPTKKNKQETIQLPVTSTTVNPYLILPLLIFSFLISTCGTF